MRKLVLGAVLSFSLATLPVVAAVTPKPGEKCSKVGATQSFKGKKYTCVKIGKKLVWNSGVSTKAPNPNTTPTPTPSSSPAPTQAASANNLNNQPCINENEVVRNSEGEFWCQKKSDGLRWSKNNVPPSSSESTPNSSSTSSPNQSTSRKFQETSCDTVGASLRDGQDLYKCQYGEATALMWKWQTGPFNKVSDKYDGQGCLKSLEILQVGESKYRCLAVAVIAYKWMWLDLSENDSRAYDLCKVPGAKIETKFGLLRCSQVRADILTWRPIPKEIEPTKNASKYLGVAAEGGKCDFAGDTFDVTGGYLECRYVAGNSLKWILLNTNRKVVSNPISPDGVETCRLKNSDMTPDPSRISGIYAGFPHVAINGINNPGVNNVLIVGMDFAEFPGDDSLKNEYPNEAKLISDWFDFYSNGKVKFNVTVLDKWVRSSRPAKDYIDQETDRLSFSMDAINRNVTMNAQPMIDEITKHIDLRNFSTVYLYVPRGMMDFRANLILRNKEFKIKEGQTHLNFFTWNSDLESMAWFKWAFAIHESLHDFPLMLHAPGNGWIEDRYTYALNSWNRFVLNWISDNQIYCVDKQNLNPTEIALSPVEREDKETKMAIVKISKTKAIVVQAHGIDKWSKFDYNGIYFRPGFYGVVAYLVDLNDAGRVSYGSDGRASAGDSGNDPAYPKWSYYKPIEGDPSYKEEFFQNNNPLLAISRHIAGLGNTFKIEGVKIEFVKSGDYETVRISLDK